jgi:hypothetical protein
MSKLWITYAWKDNEEGDFNYLVGALRKVGVEADYDRVALVPGRRLWAQIGDRITKGDLAGWAYLMTPNSIAREGCLEELACALDRALAARDGGFPLIGLLHGIHVADVPPALKIRLCVSLASPTWQEEVKAGLERRPPKLPPADASEYVIKIHSNYLGRLGITAIELRPRLGERRYWRLAFPQGSSNLIEWGTASANAASAIGGMKMSMFEGTAELDGVPYRVVAEQGPLTPTASAYLVFHGAPPPRFAFAFSTEAFGMPQQWQVAEVR